MLMTDISCKSMNIYCLFQNQFCFFKSIMPQCPHQIEAYSQISENEKCIGIKFKAESSLE